MTSPLTLCVFSCKSFAHFSFLPELHLVQVYFFAMFLWFEAHSRWWLFRVVPGLCLARFISSTRWFPEDPLKRLQASKSLGDGLLLLHSMPSTRRQGHLPPLLPCSLPGVHIWKTFLEMGRPEFRVVSIEVTFPCSAPVCRIVPNYCLS